MKLESLTTEVLYFRLFCSYLLQSKDVRDNYDILTDQYQKHPESFKVLNKYELLRLKQMQDDILNNRHTLFSGPITLDTETPEWIKTEQNDRKHTDICMSLARRKDTLLQPIIGPIDLINLEHPSRFGSIDIFILSNKICHILEIKTKPATHHIVGQMIKYYVGECLNLSLRVFNDVKLITLCPGYDQAAYRGLQNIGAKTMLLNTKTLEISWLDRLSGSSTNDPSSRS